VSRGLTLIEALVALVLSATIVTLTLAHYSAIRRGVELASGLAELQQALRASFERLTRELSAAGAAVHADGNPLSPDEAIEGAFAGAIVVRGDLDAHTPEATDPEEALSLGGSFENVRTGNDEIVAYVLGKPDGSSAEQLVFQADVLGVPRNGVTEVVTISGVDLTQADPPYVLYRVTVRSDSTASTRAPIAENVRALRFTYHDAVGVTLPPPGGAETPGARHSRSAIRRLRVELVGVVGPADREFLLAAELAPRNLGSAGAADPVGPG
jgi:Tfp pilus assembly protein PilW